MTFLNEICIRYPEAISFAPGRPLEETFNLGDINKYIDGFTHYLRNEVGLTLTDATREILQYGNTSGIIQPLLARHLELDENISVQPTDIVVTVGAQEAMVLALRALCATADDAVLVPEPCYVGIVGAAKLFNIPIVAVPETGGEITTGSLSESLRTARAQGLNPTLLYLVPSYANPSGFSLSRAQREEILAFAELNNLFILEDNPYGLFARAPNQPIATMKSLDTDGRVIYLGSFAKTGFPGARIGYLVADQITDQQSGAKLQEALAAVKSMITVNTPPIAQAVIGGLLLACDCSLKTHTRGLAARYSENLNHLLAALEANIPANRGISWNTPDGGFFTLLDVPFIADDAALERCAKEFGVLWTPMRHFFLGPGGERAIRLSSSLLSTDEISAGIEQFAAFIAKETAPL